MGSVANIRSSGTQSRCPALSIRGAVLANERGKRKNGETTKQCLSLCCVVGITLGSAAQSRPELDLQHLDVPADRLPANCELARADSDVEVGKETRVNGGRWLGLKIATNPWIGSDPKSDSARPELFLLWVFGCVAIGIGLLVGR